MASKATSETIVSKWKLKSGESKSDTELQIYKKENAALKRSLEELLKDKGKMTHEERRRLLEKILALETENEKYKGILREKDRENQHLKDELKKRGKSLGSLQNQLEVKTKELAKREQLLASGLEEMARLKNELASKCAELEKRARTVQDSQETVETCPGPTRNVNEVEIQLKDALEKNHQWLIYDQQREAYVQGLLAKISELEQQLKTVIQQEAKETQTEGGQQVHYEQQLAAARSDLEVERLAAAQLHSELSAFKMKHEETQREMAHLSALKLGEQASLQSLQDENHVKEDIIQRLTHENKLAREKLEEERKRTEELVSQVELLQRSLLKHQEEYSRIADLEQQIRADFENEKIDRQNLKHQMHKLLKELHKARERSAHLEPAKLPEHARIEVLHNFQAAFEDKLAIQDHCSSPKRLSLLDESFLECPKCKALYPTSQHRELLAHIDFCSD